jgi:hypothetical protein
MWNQSKGLPIASSHEYFILKFKENLLFKVQNQTGFSCLNQYIWLTHIHRAPAEKNW